MIRIYGQMMSRAPRCLWAAEECGVQYQLVPIRLAEGEHRTPAYLAVNPNGRIPAMEDGDLKLFESMAINLYLARKYGGTLWPAGETDQAHTLQWSFWAITELEPHLITILLQTMLVPELERRPDRIEDARNALPRPLGVLDAHLAREGWLAGGRFTIADLNVASVLIFAQILKMDLSPYGRVKSWLETCLARPAYRKVMQAS